MQAMALKVPLMAIPRFFGVEFRTGVFPFLFGIVVAPLLDGALQLVFTGSYR